MLLGGVQDDIRACGELLSACSPLKRCAQRHNLKTCRLFIYAFRNSVWCGMI